MWHMITHWNQQWLRVTSCSLLPFSVVRWHWSMCTSSVSALCRWKWHFQLEILIPAAPSPLGLWHVNNNCSLTFITNNQLEGGNTWGKNVAQYLWPYCTVFTCVAGKKNPLTRLSDASYLCPICFSHNPIMAGYFSLHKRILTQSSRLLQTHPWSLLLVFYFLKIPPLHILCKISK